ncbi:MAG: transcription factor S [Hadesarchaea archaeon]|nr:transcription factor S [Hadesarchaea archaeon]
MKFCPKCGGLLVPERKGEELKLICRGCGQVFEKEEIGEYTLAQSTRKRGEKEGGPVIVEGEKAAMPTTRAVCPKCGHDRAYWWLRQTRGADEPSTRFYKCVKCGHVWREY